MFKVLITGKGSYVGQRIKEWLEQTEEFDVDELDMIDGNWGNYDFSIYNSIIHVAAIVHRQNDKIDWETYYNVNALLPKKVAEISKAAGVKQFIFLSTMAIYGQEKKLPFGNVINANTIINPKSDYGKSKYQAELLLNKLHCENFKICIIRPPNVYGKNCPGNYLKSFVKLTKILPIFPKAFEESRQSLLFIDNLSEFIREQIISKTYGTYMPQDGLPVSTIEIVESISTAMNKKIYFSKGLGLIINHFSFLKIINKIYGGVMYDANLSELDIKAYDFCNFKEAIIKSI